MGAPNEGLLAAQSTPRSSPYRRKRLFASLALLLLLSYTALSGLHPRCHRHESSELDRWIKKQERISYSKILSNIGPPAGAGEGLVIASPSRGEVNQPDYFYTWTRDSALTYRTLSHRFLPEGYLSPRSSDDSPRSKGRMGVYEPLLEPVLREYISSQADLQALKTLSGDLWSGGLNEPKFQADGTAFNRDWGRPQRDGPALRALTLIPYAHFLLDRSHPLDREYVKHNLYDPGLIRAKGKVVKNDLEEVARSWTEPSFDLWEEVNAHHFWTRVVSLRALQAGAILAGRLDDPRAAEYYLQKAREVEKSLEAFWVDGEVDEGGHWVTSIAAKDQAESENDTVVRDLDCAFALSLIHAHASYSSDNTSNSTFSASFEPSSPGVLSTLRHLAKSFDGEYPVNNNSGDWTNGRMLGRYRDDVYDGVGKSLANPWFICTHAFAESLYLVHESLARSGIIIRNRDSTAFWTDIMGNNSSAEYVERGQEWKRGDGSFEHALNRLWDVAEAYTRVARAYVGQHGEMSEQIDRINGTQRGARDLTWSHASFLDLARTRRRVQGSKNARSDRGDVEEAQEWTKGGGWDWTGWLPDLY